ncbi:uncharacterized protein N7506_004615 [Penicillium brevicompactum]|uniref:uncharacterized protein n=1 Tax=Penicillium brevicompactum TaxID=5074 RepID=UPI00253FB55E|nr:uncharacterized protein N7506_004615 [Penicillium brevicompactum]KAJ5336593.1 hypothetical protein N7506_004615 [Penicillium brevicompactum]
MAASTLLPKHGDEPHLPDEATSLVERINQLRSMGVGEMIDLPQLLACGNEDSSKHSVIEAITRTRFPAKKVTAHFVTEIKLRRQQDIIFRVAIRSPAPTSNDTDTPPKPFLLTHVTSTDKSLSLIERGFQLIAATCRHGFSDDVLDIEIAGPDQPNLTIVDLPGLQSTTIGDKAHEEADKRVTLLRRYIKNSRSIIFAVLSADVNLQSQRILEIAAESDPKQQRTLGVITHSNKLGELTDLGSLRSEIVTRKLSLGWLLLPDHFHQLQKTPYEKVGRDCQGSTQKEDWEALGKTANNVESLQNWLGDIFAEHAQNCVPGLISDIENMIRNKKSDIPQLLCLVSDAFFDTRGYVNQATLVDSRRLRYTIHELNSHFSEAIQVIGCRRKIPDATGEWSMFQTASTNHYDNIRSPECVERAKLENEIAQQIQPDGGLHILGSPNQSLVGALFRDQTQPWDEIARVHLLKSWKSAKSCATSVLQYLTDKRTSNLIMKTLIDPEFEKYKANLLAKLEELTAYNKRGQMFSSSSCVLHWIEQCRNDRLLARIQETFPAGSDQAISKDQLRMITQGLRTSSREFAAAEIVDQMQAHYNNALWTFIDNVAFLAVENCLLVPLSCVLTAQSISNLNGTQIQELAMEPRSAELNRQRLNEELRKLQLSSQALKEFNMPDLPMSPKLGTETPASGAAFAVTSADHSGLMAQQKGYNTHSYSDDRFKPEFRALGPQIQRVSSSDPSTATNQAISTECPVHRNPFAGPIRSNAFVNYDPFRDSKTSRTLAKPILAQPSSQSSNVRCPCYWCLPKAPITNVYPRYV